MWRNGRPADQTWNRKPQAKASAEQLLTWGGPCSRNSEESSLGFGHEASSCTDVVRLLAAVVGGLGETSTEHSRPCLPLSLLSRQDDWHFGVKLIFLFF